MRAFFKRFLKVFFSPKILLAAVGVGAAAVICAILLGQWATMIVLPPGIMLFAAIMAKNASKAMEDESGKNREHRNKLGSHQKRQDRTRDLRSGGG